MGRPQKMGVFGQALTLSGEPREVYSREEEDFKKRYAFVQLLLNGITTALPITSLLYRQWAETYDEFARSADIAAELGLRVYLGPAYRTGLSVIHPDGSFDMHWDEERGLQGLEDAIAFAKAFDGRDDGLIRAMLAPDRIEGCTEELLRRTSEASAELNCPVRLHCCQSQIEVDTIEQRFGKSSLNVLHDLGFLSSRVLLPHGQLLGGVQPTPAKIDRELQWLAESGQPSYIVQLSVAVMVSFWILSQSFVPGESTSAWVRTPIPRISSQTCMSV